MRGHGLLLKAFSAFLLVPSGITHLGWHHPREMGLPISIINQEDVITGQSGGDIFSSEVPLPNNSSLCQFGKNPVGKDSIFISWRTPLFFQNT